MNAQELERLEESRKNYYVKAVSLATLLVLYFASTFATTLLADFVRNTFFTLFALEGEWMYALFGLVYVFSFVGLIVYALFFFAKPWLSLEEETRFFQSVLSKRWGSRAEYDPKKGFVEQELRDLQVFDYFSGKEGWLGPNVQFESHDLVQGTWSEIDFRIADARMWYVTSNGKSSTTHTIFNGVIIEAHCPFDFDGTTWVQPKGFTGYTTHPGEAVRLESAEFNTKYTVSTTDQTGARMALQTDIMSSVLEIDETFPAFSKPRYVFTGSSLWLCLPSSASWLDLSPWTPIEKQLSGTKAYLERLEQLMLQLKLHFIGNRTAKKGSE